MLARRASNSLLMIVGIVLGTATYATAQPYPSQPIKVIVPLPPGGPPDVVARAVAKVLQGRLGQSVLIENRPGAGTTTATLSVVTAAPDGYTLLFNGADLLYFPVLYPQVTFDPLKNSSARCDGCGLVSSAGRSPISSSQDSCRTCRLREGEPRQAQFWIRPGYDTSNFRRLIRAGDRNGYSLHPVPRRRTG